jgi:hypothetical protein
MKQIAIPALAIVSTVCCGGDGADPDAATDSGADVPADADAATDPVGGWPEPNEHSWNGGWTPDCPVAGLLDEEYGDGHPDTSGDPTPVLPPGRWDWDDGDDDLANWRNFEANIGTFEMLVDGDGCHFGWRLACNDVDACDYSGPAADFSGSPGTDVLDLGPGGAIHSFTDGELGDGPDVLVFEQSWTLDFRTGSSLSGADRDDDLVMGGCGANPDGAWDVTTTTIHTGPGADWVFIRDISRAAVDLGNGEGGRTDAVDPADDDDLLVVRGNAHDFRVFGGAGDDVAVWWVDENVQTTTWLGPNFFGGGGYGDALWEDAGTDTLVLAVPADTPIVTSTPTPPGALLVMPTDGVVLLDDPTQHDPFARYCIECGTGPGGRKTVILEYLSADESVHTGYFFVTAFEVLQVGVGDGATVWDVDDAAGAVTPSSVDAYEPPGWPSHRCE